MFFNYTKEVSEYLTTSIKRVYNSVESLNNKIISGISEYNKILETMVKENVHQSLKLIKDSFISIKNDMNNLKIEFTENNKEKAIFMEEMKKFDSFNKDHSDIITNINNLINEIEKSDNIKMANISVSSFTELVENSINKTFKKVDNVNNMADTVINNILEIVNVEISTSLDLLFIMDITGSMGSYLEKTKSNILAIINGIITECPGIDINLGFIGYRDYYESYIDIDFTQDHAKLKSIISSVHASGGGDYPEDVAFALELALKKTWTSNARFAVFVADAPGHGTKYGGDNDEYKGKPERRLIEEMIAEMAEENISLFCLRISSGTDTMYKIFEDIYNDRKSDNTMFLIVDNNLNSIPFYDVVVNNAISVYYLQRKSENQDCLMANDLAIDILESSYGIKNSKIDNNLRFLLGKCSPVLLIPGIFATKLTAQFNCNGLATYEKETTLKEIRLYCGKSVCKDEKKTNEEHSLLVSVSEFSPFKIIKPLGDNEYSACLGHIANYFQNENECQKVKGKNTCFYSKYVKIAYYGGTQDTLKESKCGIEGISDVIQTDLSVGDAVINRIKKVGHSFKAISKELKKKGYKEGFSLGALPNDYRRYLATNNFASNVFKSQINRLYANTGKPVIIIAHSYGTLLTLTNLLKNQNDKEFMKKIKKFIAMAPPFSGSLKLFDAFFHGLQDWDSLVTEFNVFGQYMWFKSLPTIMELRPLSIAPKIFTDSSYKELGDALRDRLEIEKDCKTKDCDVSSIKSKTSAFDKLFKGYFPSLLDPECSYESKIEGNQETLNRKCYTTIYNVGDCPSIITKSVNPNKDDFDKNVYCNKKGKEYFYQGECNNSERNCLDQLYYSDKCPNAYNNIDAVNFLLDRFNKESSEEYGAINKTYFDNYETIKTSVKNSLEYQEKISLIKELPVPPVDTVLLYGSFSPTLAGLVMDDDDFTKTATKYYRGGDETVPTWSSLLTGLKWIYDKKKKSLPQNIQLVEYCSRLSNSGQYQYDPKRNQNFSAIGCKCLDEKKNIYNDEISECSHAEMLNDENLVKYIVSVVNDPKEIDEVTDSKKQAVKNYKPEYDYTGECDKDIYNILNTADLK